MNIFDVHGLSHVMQALYQTEVSFNHLKVAGHGSERPERESFTSGKSSLGFAANYFQLHEIGKCSQYVRLATHQWERPLLDVSGATEIFHRLQIDIVSELENKKFLKISDDRGEFIDNERLFGDQVHDAFSSAKEDIIEVGNCLAVECNTAAVFHLMRICEFGLRALAKDRNIEFKDKPLELKEWGQIVPKLDSVLKEMRDTDVKRWRTPEIKESQIHFYSELMPDARAFNEAWRRHLSHADPEAFYDRNYAASIMEHVKNFMQRLATKISEQKSTPEYWDSL